MGGQIVEKEALSTPSALLRDERDVSCTDCSHWRLQDAARVRTCRSFQLDLLG